MADFTIENVCRAIYQFQNGQVSESEEFLKQFSKSSEAWNLCISLLTDPDVCDDHIILHLIRILKTKILYDFISLQPEQVSQLFPNCIHLITRHGKSNQKNLRLQSVLIFVYLYIYTYQQQSLTVLEFLTNTLNCLEAGLDKFFFDALEAFPEELIENKNIIMDANQLKAIRNDIKNKQMIQIIEYLRARWAREQIPNTKFHIIRAYKKWLEFMKSTLTSLEAIQYVTVSISCPLLHGALQSLAREELQDKSVEAICSFVRLIPKEPLTDPTVLNGIMDLLFTNIFNSFADCLKALDEDLSDEIFNYTKLYVKVGKKFMPQIVANPQLDPFINTAIAIFCHPNSDDVCEELCSLWTKFVKTLKSIPDQSQQAKWEQVLIRLIDGCVDKSKVSREAIDPKEEKKSEEEVSEDKERLRTVMRNIIEDLVELIPPCRIINRFGVVLQEKFIPNPDVHGFRVFEACMHLMKGLIEQIKKMNDQLAAQYLAEILSLYFNLVSQNNEFAKRPFIIRAILRVISYGCTQLITSSGLISQLFGFINMGFSTDNKGTIKKAAKAFQTICTENQQFVKEHLNEFLELIYKSQKMPKFENVLKGVAIVVCSSDQTIKDYYLKLCGIFAENLRQAQALCQLAINEGEKKKIEFAVEQACKEVSHFVHIISQAPQNEGEGGLVIRPIVYGVFIELWPLIQFFLFNFSKVNQNITEKIVRFIKFTFRNTFDSFQIEMLAQIFHAFGQVYRECPISSCIYVAEVAVTVFYKYLQYGQTLMEAFENNCKLTFQHLPQLQSFEDNPELTEDFFGMLVRYGRYMPTLVLQSSALPIILQLTLQAIGIEHVSAAKAFYAWLEVVMKMQKPFDDMFRVQISEGLREKFQQLAIPYIPQFLSKLFEAIRKGPTEQEMEEYIGDCIFAIAELHFVNYKQLLFQVLEEGPSNLLTWSEKQDWVEKCGEKSANEEYLELYSQRCYQSLLRN